MPNRCFKEIIEANDRNRLAIFIGAGVSKTSNNTKTSMPDWKELINIIKGQLDFSASDNNQENDLLRIAQLYYLKVGKKTYYDNIIKYITDKAEPSSVHKQIFSLNPNCIITTNWDSLLERTNNENGYAYELIRNDAELVNSTVPYKIIKMHGDLKLRNIVFKESDYIQYQEQFPLIENFIKSILCTHTTLFLGYSYNDINLKQIINWINANSRKTPPMYFFTSTNNHNQEQYLENFGIKTIYYRNDNNTLDDFEELLKDDFLNSMEQVLKKNNETTKYKFPDLKDCLSLSLANFLFDLSNYYYGINYKNISDIDVLGIIYSKLSHLTSLEYVLPDQIQNVFTNSSFVYPQSKPIVILRLHTTILTTDYNPIERFLNKRFIEIARKYDENQYNDESRASTTMKNILNIIAKANIDGLFLYEENNLLHYLILNKNHHDSDNLLKYIIKSPSIKSKSKLKRLKTQIYNLCRSQQFERAFDINEHFISVSSTTQNYENLLIAFDNKNVLIQKLRDSRDKGIRNKFQYEKSINIYERLATSPKIIRNRMLQIYRYISFDSFYKTISYSRRNLKSINEQNQTRQHGRIFLSNENPIRFSKEHRSILSFHIFNHILSEISIEFQEINQTYVELSLAQQELVPETFLNDAEAFACIKYFDNKSLIKLFQSFYAKEAKRRLKINEESLTILTDEILPEFISIQDKWNSKHTNYDDKFYNLLFILSLIEEINIDNIFIQLNKVFFKNRNNLTFYKSINFFLTIQYNLYKKAPELKLMKKSIESMINYIIANRCTGHDLHLIQNRELRSLFQIASISDKAIIKYSYVTKIIDYISKQPNEYQITYSTSLLLNLYYIVGQKSKKLIKKFLLSIDTSIDTSLSNSIDFQIDLINFKFTKLDSKLIICIRNYTNSFNYSFYRILEFLESYNIDDLDSDNERNELAELIIEIKSKLNNNEERINKLQTRELQRKDINQ